LLARAQVLVHLVYGGDFHGYYLPNKIFEYLGAGKPILYSGTGDIAEIITKACSGLVVEPENSHAFADAAIWLRNHPQEAQDMGRRGKKYVMRHFNRQSIMTDLTRVLENL
jgi:glycosyltransferase involved in cell wall biosynthesis